MSAVLKPRFRLADGAPVPMPSRETPIEAARRRYGRPFAHEGGHYVHTKGPSFWTAERVAALSAANEAHRKARK